MSTVVNQYRIYCNTESSWVYIWGESPTTCINNTAHSVNINSVQLIQSVSNSMTQIINNYTDTLESSRVVQQTTIIDLKSFHGIPVTQNATSTNGSGVITATAGTTPEIKLRVSSSSDSCTLRSKRRGFYITGLVSECGMGIRIPDNLDTTQELRFGYFDENNGYYFKLLGTDLSVCVLYEGTETTISRSNFNKNKLNGTEDNGITLDFARGNIFRVDFTWYGFGSVRFGVIQSDSSNNQKLYPMHIFNTSGSTSCGNPNLPINIILDAGSSNLQRDVYVAGRQYSILGKVLDSGSLKNVHNFDSTSSGSAKAVISIKVKTAHVNCSVALMSLNLKSSADATIQILKNSTLTGANFQTSSYVEDTCADIDTSATAFSGGTICKSYNVYAGETIDIDFNEYNVYELDTLTIVWSAVISSTIRANLHWSERW